MARRDRFKERVRQKKENSVIISSHSTCSKPVWAPFFCWTWKKIFWRTKQLLIPIIIPILWKSKTTYNCLFTNILQNIFFCVQQKKETHTGLKQLGWVKGDSFHFWVNCLFKLWFSAHPNVCVCAFEFIFLSSTSFSGPLLLSFPLFHPDDVYSSIKHPGLHTPLSVTASAKHPKCNCVCVCVCHYTL